MTQHSDFKKAFILHTRPYGETSLIIDFFSEAGRLSTVAKGVRQIKSKRKGLLQPFQPLMINWVGTRELKTLTQVEVSEYFKPLWGDALLSGLYINELLYRLLPRFDPHPHLLQQYENTLHCLQFAELSIEKTLRVFEMQLLKELGYGLSLTQEAQTGEAIKADKYYFFEPNSGLVAYEGVHNARCFLGGDILQIANHEFTGAEILLAAKRLMRLAMADLLAEYDIFSRKLFA